MRMLKLTLLWGAAWASLAGPLPNPQLTPGAVLAVTKQDVCTAGYTKKVRNVPASVKRQVFARYGIPYRQHRLYEVDHFCPLEIGGSNSMKNLSPEAYDLNVDGFQMGAREKDKAENAAHRAVCSGKMSLSEAQQQMMTDWTVLYKKLVHPTFPRYGQDH